MARKTDKPLAPSPSLATSLDVDALRQIIEILEASEVTRLVWSNGTEKVSIRRGAPAPMTQVVQHLGPASAPTLVNGPSAPAQPAAATEHRAGPSAPVRPATAEAPPAPKGHVITSPFVGTFYRSPAPDQPSFVEVGSPIKKGQVICIVEAMKLMNEIESEVTGKVVEVLAQNAQPVEFGQPLFRIEPA
jgi:acetyl-CoA carboxylase biotin carboxyl carrier protein